ncbi:MULTISPECIES: hypothetical protein [unclassified Sporolactobacillus]|uniref:hypothetical protein n=1 Tax=unclassified Sporolactobacillus TaxID=2628533 RepID=UPI00236855BE|nr:hypothetical protein [Sporolactobacillus sp. CQH2019]MDD9150463.1 hypothetical protein [Sporolactobacillus sp. CQH2019]
MIRKNIRLKEEKESRYGLAYLEAQQERLGGKSLSDTIEKVLAEHDRLRAQVASRDELIEKVYARFKTDLDVLRIRSGYVDKNVRVLLELWNSQLMSQRPKNGKETFIPTTMFKSSILQQATDTVSNVITEQQIRMKERAEKKKQREAAQKAAES